MGFRKNASCGHAIFCVMEAIRSNKRKFITTYLCAIDATKAFDKVERNILFSKVKQKTSPLIARIVILYYNSICFFVMNNQEISNKILSVLGVGELVQGCLHYILMMSFQ